MDLTRRDALKLAGVGAALTAAPTFAWAKDGWPARNEALYPPGNRSPWPILQGPTDHRSASLVLLLPSRSDIVITIADDRGRARPWRIVDRFDMPEIGLMTTEIQATDLAPGRDYVLAVVGAAGDYADRRLFRALDTSLSRPRFAVASCMNEGFKRHAVTMWEALARERCDFVVLLGDTCYADLGNPRHTAAGYAKRYTETRLTLAWFQFERLVPTFAVWDDHDFGRNNGDRTTSQASITGPLFRAFWGAAENSAWHRGLGVGSRLEAFGQRFYLLDDRSFRDPPGSPTGRQWGESQTEWLLREVGRDARPAWLMNGSQFIGGHRRDESVEGDHPADFRDLHAGLARLAAPVAFVSGDVHFSEIRAFDRQRLGYETFEFTSSSIHSFPKLGPIGRGNLVADRRHNFMVFDAENGGEWDMRCRAVLEDNAVAFDRSFAIRR